MWSVEGVFGAEMTDQPPAPQFRTELLQARPVLKGRVATQLMKEACQERGERSPYLRSGGGHRCCTILVGCVGKENDLMEGVETLDPQPCDSCPQWIFSSSWAAFQDCPAVDRDHPR